LSRRFSKWALLVLVGLLCIALVAFPACTTTGEQQEEEEEEEELITIPYANDGGFVFQTIGEIDSLDPAWIYDTASGMQVGLIYDTLLYYDGTSSSEFVPMLATDWSFNEADNTLTFTIRDGVKFHNGDTLTPEDVEYTFERAMVQDRPGGPVWMFFQPLFGDDIYGLDDTTFADIDASVEVDGDSVVFTLAGAYWQTAFLQILCGQWASIVDKSWCIAEGDWDGTEGDIDRVKHPQDAGDTVLFDLTNGTGPWKLDLWESGIQLRLTKNDDYWRGDVPFDYVITQVVDEWTNRKLALLNGDADLVYVPATQFDEMDDIESQTEDLQVFKELPSLSIDAFFFNMAIAEDSSYIGSGALDGAGIPTDFFMDEDVRKGACYAFDYETYISDALNDQGVQRGSPVVEGLYGYDPDTPMYEYDLDKAEEHFKAAWGGELWEKGCKFTLLYNVGNLPRKTACELLAEGMFSVNPLFEVSIQPLAWPTILGKIFGSRDMPMFQIGWLPDYPHADNFIVPFMASYGTFSHFQGYGSAELDAEIQAAFQETDLTQSLAAYAALQQRYYDDAPGIVLAQPIARRYFTKYIGGFYYNPVESSYAGRVFDLTKSES
jgi:peptide/nickel transport system substrate-binding protein